ncbi:signal transduction histidine kinase [Alteromonadaceae bacterium 2753L.S.0a.02]|nr:signal transduction histidine kinase [Alteromonadaceae bacterium 2753L.S.0a.02]
MSEPNSVQKSRLKSGYKKVVGVNRRRLLLRTAFVWLVFQVVFYLVHIGITSDVSISWIASCSLILTALIVIAAQRNFATRWLGITLMLVVFISLGNFSFEYGGLDSPFIIFQLFVPVATFMLVSRPAGWVATAIICSYFAVLGLLDVFNVRWSHHALAAPYSQFLQTLALILVMVCISGIGWYYSRLYDRFYFSLKKTNEDLQRTADYKSEFLSSMSHEFRTPLNAIIGFSRRLSRKGNEVLSERDIRSLEAILRNGELMESLVSNVLHMASIDSGDITINPEKTDIFRLIKQSINDYQPQADAKNIELRFITCDKLDAEGRVLEANIDSEKLRRVIGALLSNAVKYTEQGYVQVSLDYGEDWFEIQVRDTGKGVTKEDIPLMFDRFKRLAEQDRSANIGTGLGLAISLELVKLAGGELSASSQLGEGSVFILRQPRFYQ